MKAALGISADFTEGSAFDRELQEQKKLERKVCGVCPVVPAGRICGCFSLIGTVDRDCRMLYAHVPNFRACGSIDLSPKQGLYAIITCA